MIDEVVLFVSTAVGFLVGPARFADDWANGRRRAMNPLGFLATSAAVLVPVRHYCLRRFGIMSEDGSFAWQIYESLQPFLLFIGLGIFCHPVMRLAGSKRRLRSTLAVSLYTGGGPATGVELFGNWPLVALLHRTMGKTLLTSADLHSPAAWAFTVAFLGAFLVYLVTFARALQGLHQLRWWWAALALLVGIGINGAVARLVVDPLLVRVLHAPLRFS
jgi:hypothetical protein